ncbi:MAG: hypothetical protein JOZ69_09220 [Myxococcales bacterium]|nr:hypothetical protein [Myxococcales bacterium]
MAPLRAFENDTRAATDFARKPSSLHALGADPYVIRALPEPGPRASRRGAFVGLLRGRDAIVLLDDRLGEIARLPAPGSPSGLAVSPDGEVLVVGELASRVARYRVGDGTLRAAGSIALPDVRAMRDVAVGPEGVVYVAEEHDGRVLALRRARAEGNSPPAWRTEALSCHEPMRVRRTRSALLVDCFLDHAVVVRRVDGRGVPRPDGEVRIAHDGPIWGFDAIEDEDGGLLVATGGVEDRPLDRTEGSFGFIDSFVTVYRVATDGAVKRAEVNTAALGVVTPKAIHLARRGARLDLSVTGYASDHLALLSWDAAGGAGAGSPLGEPAVSLRPVVPGLAMMDPLPDGVFVAADPLLDAWVREDERGAAVVHVDDDSSRARAVDSRLGEALFFTTLMAPWDRSDGRLSRFTCETCHWEGYVDGRTHHTGRGDIRATTKPLLGLFNNRPHFSRALDPDLTTMVNNEFRVASAKSDHDPWFSLQVADFAWLRELGVAGPALSPESLRRALMTFFMDFTHRPNPSVVGRAGFTPLERRGAEAFRDRCEMCHAARLVADEPATRLPFDRWEERVLSPEGAIVWAHADYEKTGVVPYVNERGARVVSLRRLYKKYPYFTNGSAKTLGDVLDRVGWTDRAFFHDGRPEGAATLDEEHKAALLAFLDLL